MTANKYKVLLLLSFFVNFVNAKSPGNMENKLTESQIRWNKKPGALYNALFEGQASTMRKWSYNIKDLISSCRQVKGAGRKQCVATYIRNLYPDVFRKSKEGTVEKQQTTKINITTTEFNTTTQEFNITTAPELPSSVSTTTASIETACDRTVATKAKKIVLKPSKAVEKRNTQSTSFAVLIVPGDKKKVMSIIQDMEANVRRVNDVAIKAVTCRKEEFGFADDVDPRILDLASDMLCSLCQSQLDGLCIVRWCFDQ